MEEGKQKEVMLANDNGLPPLLLSANHSPLSDTHERLLLPQNRCTFITFLIAIWLIGCFQVEAFLSAFLSAV